MHNTGPTIKRNEIRLNRGKRLLVEVRYSRYDEDEDVDYYFVEEIKNPGQFYWLHEASLSGPLNVMEVLAWATVPR